MKTKLSLFIAVLAVGLFGMGCASTEPAFVSDGLVAYYPFNGNAKDESGNGNDGELKGVDLTGDRHQKPNEAFEFTGKSRMTFEPSDIHKQSNITISFWMLLGGHKTGKSEILVYRHEGFQLFMLKRQTLNFGYWVGAGGISWMDPVTVSLDQISKADWVMMTFTYDGKEQCIMMNGKKIASNSNLKPIKYDGSEPLVFGYNPHYFNQRLHDDQYFYGRLDDVRIYNRALSAEEVKALYDLEKPKGK